MEFIEFESESKKKHLAERIKAKQTKKEKESTIVVN